MFEGQSSTPEVIQPKELYDQESIAILEATLQFSSLKLHEQISYRAVKIYQKDYLHQIYTCNQKSNLPHIVLLHGFGGTAMTYVRIFKYLKQFYQVHALDSFGVGHSSRGNFDYKFNYQETKNYFIDAIEEWRKKLGIQTFTLCGHSFGGYISTLYVEKYSKYINRLILLSPVGATQKTDKEIEEQLETMKNRNGLKSKFFMFFAEKIYNMNIRPSKAMNNMFIGNKMIDRIVSHRLKLESEEKQLWTKYFKNISKSDHNSQSGFYIIFEWPLKPKHTIESILKRLKLKISVEFYFGDHDWMDAEGAKRLAAEQQNIKFQRISNADHQIIFDNPEEVCLNIIGKKQQAK